MAEEVLKALANSHNQAILNLLSIEPSYPRRIGDLLGMDETAVARRLRHMENLGLVSSGWEHIGKNVKVYRLVPASIDIRFGSEGMAVEIQDEDGVGQRSTVVDHLKVRVPAVDGFVGRTDELERIGQQPVTLIGGLPGIGKTSLVSAYAHKAMDAKPVFFHAFRGVESLEWFANRLAVFAARQDEGTLLEAVEAGAALPDLRQLVLDLLDDGRFIFVLDDVDTVEEEALSGVFDDAIAQVQDGTLIMAARERMVIDPGRDNVETIWLEGLDDEGVLSFLEAKDVDLDPKLLPRVNDEVGGHPLALNLLVETARSMGVEIPELLDQIPEQDLEAYLLTEVTANLTDSERRVLTQASVFRTEFTTDDLQAVSTRNPTGGLLKLRRRQLVQDLGGTYSLHEVLRNFFYHRLEDKAAFHEKAAKHYLSRGTIEARLEAMHHFLAAGRRQRALRLIEEDLDLEDFDIIDSGYHNLYLSILERFDPEEVRDDRRAALLDDELGDLRFHRGEYETALDHYQEATGFFERVDEAERRADLAWKRALCLVRLDRAAEATDLITQGLEVAPTDGLAFERLHELAERLDLPAPGAG